MNDQKKFVFVAFCYAIATHLTNTGRAVESNANSKDNLLLVNAFRTPQGNSCGWDNEFPAVLVSMKNWVFEKGHDPLDPEKGCTAQEYVDSAMAERAADLLRIETAWGSAKNEYRSALEAELRNYKDIFCDSKGELIKLTVANSYWVDSGHQRVNLVYVPARKDWLMDKLIVDASNAAALKEDATFKATPFPEFRNTIPSIIREYNSFQEVCYAQYRGNESASTQNKTSVLDKAKSARQLIGYGSTPKISETDFRGKSGGAAARFAYQLALGDSQFGGKLGLFKGLYTTPKTEMPGSDKKQDNPAYIPVANLSLDNVYDPMRNISVVNRLCDQTLKAMELYKTRNGPGRMVPDKKSGAFVEAPNMVSAIEAEVLERGYAWTKEEFAAWVETLKPNMKGYRKTIETDPNATVVAEDVGLDKKMVTAILSSSSTKPFIRGLITDVSKGNDKDGNTLSTMEGTVGDAMQSVLESKNATLQTALVDLHFLHDGAPALYATTVASIASLVAKARASLESAKVEEPTTELATA